MKHDSGAYERKRDSGQRNERRPNVHEEQHQDQNDENATVAQSLDNVRNGAIDKRLLRVERFNPQIFGQRWPQIGDGLYHVIRDLAGVGRGLLVDCQDDGWSARELPVLLTLECSAVATFFLSSFDDASDLG